MVAEADLSAVGATLPRYRPYLIICFFNKKSPKSRKFLFELRPNNL
ncbi:hypothetical protein C943_03751 [Mariniradius saccharolyticus AK6]|uniref:Uncharacterized protein n=1 Tax=Mariniradius saccharolyticus AK6 TaxID=1239962 RepID=M7YBG9_9BACT|nr:hypothetical protein C943_03751 [Mariniradius saccharolyticus AK6]